MADEHGPLSQAPSARLVRLFALFRHGCADEFACARSSEVVTGADREESAGPASTFRNVAPGYFCRLGRIFQ